MKLSTKQRRARAKRALLLRAIEVEIHAEDHATSRLMSLCRTLRDNGAVWITCDRGNYGLGTEFHYTLDCQLRIPQHLARKVGLPIPTSPDLAVWPGFNAPRYSAKPTQADTIFGVSGGMRVHWSRFAGTKGYLRFVDNG